MAGQACNMRVYRAITNRQLYRRSLIILLTLKEVKLVSYVSHVNEILWLTETSNPGVLH